MKKSNVIWFILGGLALIALGFVGGYALNGGFMRPAALANGAVPYGAMPYMRGFGGRMMGLPFFGFGLGLLFMTIQGLGPIAGIVALIIVLTRRPAAPPAPIVAAPPAPAAEKPKAAKK
jgi:hypothetical protein